MNRSEKNEDIYTMLPRFVTEAETGREKPRFLPVIKRPFERNGIKFKFEITPACIGIKNAGTTNFYPGAVEQLMEAALRRLAVEDNPNFMRGEGIVAVSFTELAAHLEDLSGGEAYSPNFVMRSLTVMCYVGYELSDGERRMGFRPINWLREREKNGEKYYLVQLSSIFLNGNEMFDFCFGYEISKNPDSETNKIHA